MDDLSHLIGFQVLVPAVGRDDFGATGIVVLIHDRPIYNTLKGISLDAYRSLVALAFRILP